MAKEKQVRRLNDVPDDDAYEFTPPAECRDEDTERWNQEWLRYLRRLWPMYLAHHGEFVGRPALPETAMGMLDLRIGKHSPLGLYCDREWIEGKALMEMGCGPGDLGKLLGRYAKSYLGTDYSTLALQLARLVSPENCVYVHVGDAKALGAHHGAIDTVICRHFWIHQNLRIGRANLEFMARFLRTGGRVYCDFFRLDEERQDQALTVLPPSSRLSKSNPSSTFQYTPADLDKLIAGLPFKVIGDEESRKMQRWYVVLERT